MSHEIDLSMYYIHYSLDLNNVKISEKNIKKYENVNVIDMDIDKEKGKIIAKPPGKYVTITFSDITDSDNYNKLYEILKKELNKFTFNLGIKKDDSVLIVGLGNDKSSIDSLGPKTVDKVIPTNHIYMLKGLSSEYRRVSIFKPGVIGSTGMDTVSVVTSVVKTLKPNFVIVIDSLRTNDINNLYKTVQITDSGISPGSAFIKNKRLDKKTLKIPIISIGIPVALDSTKIGSNLLGITSEVDYLVNKFSDLLSNVLNTFLHNKSCHD